MQPVPQESIGAGTSILSHSILINLGCGIYVHKLLPRVTTRSLVQVSRRKQRVGWRWGCAPSITKFYGSIRSEIIILQLMFTCLFLKDNSTVQV